MKIARTILMALVATVLAAGTVFEKYRGNEWVAEHFYSSWWFTVLLGLVAVGAVVGIVTGKMWRRPSALLVHAAVPVILLGGALTTWTGLHGTLTLTPGEPARSFVADGAERPLPFSVTLDRFEVVPYPGTHTPMDFVSHIAVDGMRADISMNHIYRRDGYRFYQEDYDDEGRSVLSVSRDPWGIGVTYCGYALLLVGMLWLMLTRRGRFRKLLRGGVMATMVLLPLQGFAAQVPPTLPRATAERMGEMYVLYKGRVCPLQTFAKDFTTKLTGQATYRGLSSEQVLSGWLFYFDEWADEPMIKIKGDELHGEAGTEGQASYRQLLFLADRPLTPAADKNLREAVERFNLVRMLHEGRQLKLYPLQSAMGGLGWYAQNDPLPKGTEPGDTLFVREQFARCSGLVMQKDLAALEREFLQTLEFQQQKAAGTLPSEMRVRAERLYNALTTGRWLAMVSITLGLLVFAFSLYLTGRGREMPRALRWMALLWVALLTTFLLLIFALRWIVGGHVPMAGGFDSMNLMAVAIGLIGIGLSFRHAMALPVAMLTMGFCQLVAMMSGSNPPVTNLMPVLSSPLLTLHVTVIMFAYALFFFIMMGGVAGLVLGLQRKRLQAGKQSVRFHRISMLMLYPAVFLLALGIVIGAVWANISWGNYWSWDPKEVWALITLIVYTLPLHPSLGICRKPMSFHLYSILAFLSVIITYFGVNFLLGGMHAYG